MLVCGVDIVEVSRVEGVLARHGRRFLDRIYSPLEEAVSRGRAGELAARFAAKEAVSKALGVGIFGSDGLRWRDVEVLPDRRGRPLLYLYGRALARSRDLGISDLAVSLSHDGGLAIAMVVGQSAGLGEPADLVAWRATLASLVAQRLAPAPASSEEM